MGCKNTSTTVPVCCMKQLKRRETPSIGTGDSDRHLTSSTPATYFPSMRWGFFKILVLVTPETHCH